MCGVLTCVDVYQVLHAVVGQAVETVPGPHGWLRDRHANTDTICF